MAMTALERKAVFKAAVTLRELTMAQAAASMGVSYNHLMLVLRGDRLGSSRLEGEIAAFVNRPVRELFRGRRGVAG
jgi:transcriptional regulator with XRE-family HTH domain